MGIEDRFDIPFVAAMALREKQIQQRYRPIIGVHKWFARRPGSLFRALLLAEFDERPLAESFFAGHDLKGRVVADPFMGGGTPLLEANRLGCHVIGCDINPMAAWIVREEIEQIDLQSYRAAAERLLGRLEARIGTAYQTDCPLYGDRNVPVKYFLWVKTIECEHCGREVRLFPGYVVARNVRHPLNVLVCAQCGELNEVQRVDQPGKCRACAAELSARGPARRNRCACTHCGRETRYPRPELGPPQHRMFAIEYYNPHRKHQHRGRFFKRPDAEDLARYQRIHDEWATTRGAAESAFVPADDIPPGDETARLHRWGYRAYQELFNGRQLLGLELAARLLSATKDQRVRRALATNFSDLLRYQNMLCRYDTTALKSLDVFSIHGFPAGLVQCESNLLGIRNPAGACVGSGGWANMVEKFCKAKAYCDEPFEMPGPDGPSGKGPIYTRGEWIGRARNGARPRRVTIRCCSSTDIKLKPGTLDAVLTDPPYFANVQYGELMDFCYVWLRRLVGRQVEGFDRLSSRSPDELTGNASQGRGLDRFAEGLSRTFQTMAAALKPGGPLAFTFHHTQLAAYSAIGVAVLDAGLTCSAALPCPAEMGGSIHIHGTNASTIDTVFVCRARQGRGKLQESSDVDALGAVVRGHLEMLRCAGVRPRPGDIRCMLFGQITRAAIRRLGRNWRPELAINERLKRFNRAVSALGDPEPVVARLAKHVRVS